MDGAAFLQHDLPLRVAHGDFHQVGTIAQIHRAPAGQRQRGGRVHHTALKAQGVDQHAIDLELHRLPGLVLDGHLDDWQRWDETGLRMQPFGARRCGGNPFVVVGQGFDQLQGSLRSPWRGGC